MKKQDFFVIFLLLVAFRQGKGSGPPAPGYAYDGNFNAICDIKFCVLFCSFALTVYVKAILMVLFCNLYDHAKSLILLVKVKIALNSSCNLKL